jgi:uncharacterized membrane-anchored protein YjiN (DUF445 family)
MTPPPTPAGGAASAVDPRARTLRTMKAIALSLFAAALAGLVLSHAMGARGAWGWLRAFCEAAAVGALADWFAVVALFRRPLGLPIPHTAIIPSNKERIADSLAAFVRDHFLDPDALRARLALLGPATRLAGWLSDAGRVRSWSGVLRSALLRGLDLLDDDRLATQVHAALRDAVLRWNAAGTVGEILGFVTKHGRHQQLLDAALRQVGDWVDTDAVRARIAALLLRYFRAEYPMLLRLIGAVVSIDELAAALARNVAATLVSELESVLRDPGHELRGGYERQLAVFVERLRTDPELAADVDRMKRAMVEHEATGPFVRSVVDEARAWLRRDLEREDSALGRQIERALQAIGRAIGEDAALRDAIDAHVVGASGELARTLREGITRHIAATVRDWDERQLVRELELAIGRDLQYIRFNGTLVGGAVGLLLHAGLQLAGPLGGS